jgi:anti-sigma B factor antagonist
VSFELVTLPHAPGGGQVLTVIQIRGDVDASNAAGLEDALAALAGGALIVDLSGVGYFDSAGFAVLDRVSCRAPLAVVVAPGSVVRKAMTLLNLLFYDTIDAARASLLSA